MSNDKILLDSMLNQLHSQIAASMDESYFFEIFSAEQITKDFDLSYEIIEDGIVDGGGDGSIDSIFTFVNNEILTEDFSFENIKRNPQILLYLIQSKTSSNFSENQIAKTIANIQELFDLSKTENDLKSIYNSKLLANIFNFRNVFLLLSSKHPALEIKFIYVSKGNTQEIHPNVISKGRQLIETFKRLFTSANINVEYLGARELLDISRIEKKYTLQLKFEENYISRDNNYVILSNIVEYYNFVTDQNLLRKYIFEFNVRDYEGNVEVNKDIKDSLNENTDIDFWNLNNGITIICSKASIVGKVISMDDVQIVNGLQTTHIIYNYINSKKNKEKERRSLLIKIVVTDDPMRIDKIIKATNFQTMIRDSSFKATDSIQRDIEQFFLQNGWYYERRKNYYKNTNKQSDRIVSIAYLAQSILAIILKEPNNSRGRPTTLIKKNDDYARIFNKEYKFTTLLFCARLMKEIDIFIRKKIIDVPWQELSTLRFHIALQYMINKKGENYKLENIEEIENESISLIEIDNATKKVLEKIEKFKKEKNDIAIDTIAKSKTFMDYFKIN